MYLPLVLPDGSSSLYPSSLKLIRHCILEHVKPFHAYAKSPHCLQVSWKTAAYPVTGYTIYCFPGDSQKADVVKYINNVKESTAIISGLKPETVYRVAIAAVSSGSEGTQVFSKDEVKLRKAPLYNCY